jgi:L-cysteine/cystine lyase
VASDETYHRKTEAARVRIAALVGAEAQEIAFTRNATDGINLALAGLDWQPGDEVITTDEEHPAMFHPLMYLHKTKGLRLVRLAVSPRPEVMLQRLAEAVTRRTRMVAMSLVTCESGTRLPAQAICQWAAGRGLLSLFDGAQASGAIPVDVRQMGCDFYASNGHKWLCGPKGSGFFYARMDRLERLSPAHVGAGSMQRVDWAEDIAEPFHSGQRFEFGTRAWAISAGLSPVLDWFDGLGWANVYRHIAALAGYLKERIAERPNLKLLTPLAAEESAGLTSFSVAGRIAEEVSATLRQERRIYVRLVHPFNALRIATAHFNNAADIDRLMEALDSM